MTGRSLMRRLLKVHDNLLVWATADVIPLGSRVVMEACCDIIASSADGWHHRCDVERTGAVSLAREIAVRIGLHGGEAEIAGYMHRLHRVGLLILDEDGLGMRLPLPEEPDLESDGGCPDDPDSDWMDGGRT